MNEEILKRVPGLEIKYYSEDKAICESEEEAAQYPMEFLHSITPTGMAPHCLKLKKGAIIVLIRSLNNNTGLCNGTRLKVNELHPNFIDGTILTGDKSCNRVFIPRIKLAPSYPNLPFTLSRRQFPIRFAFVKTMNKAQGATYKGKVGIYLAEPVFSHGQLYVAFSRARSFNNVRVKVLPTTKQGVVNGRTVTINAVWRAALD